MIASIFEKIPVPVIIVDPESFIIQYANKPARAITGLETELPEDSFLSDFFSSDDFESIRNKIFTSNPDNGIVLENIIVNGVNAQNTYHVYIQPVKSNDKGFLQIQLLTESETSEDNDGSAQTAGKPLDGGTENFDTLLKNELLPLAVISKDYKVQAFNNSAAGKVREIVKGELKTGAAIQEILPELETGTFKKLMDKVFEGESFTKQVAFGAPNEGIYSLTFFFQPLYGSDGKVSNILIAATDGTALRRSRETAQEADEKLETALLLSIDAIIMIDTQHRIVLFNQAAQEIYKYELYEVIGQSIEKLIPSRFHGVYFNKVSGFDTGKSGRNDLAAIRGVRKDGTELPLELTFIPLETGGSRYYMLLMRDIGKRKALEEKLHKQRSLFRAVADNVSDLILHYDREGICVFASGNSKDILGFSPSEFLQTSLFDNIHKADIPILRSAQLQLREEGLPMLVPARRMNKQGDFLSFQNMLTPLMSFETGKFESIAVIARQIDSEEKDKTDATQRALEAALEGKGNEELRNLAEMNKKLSHSEKRLKDTIAAKDKFFSIIAHDLRGPFTGLLGVAEFLCEDIDDLSSDEIKQYSGSIYKSARAVFNLLDNLLQWSRVQTGRIEFNPARFFIDDLIAQVIDIFSQNAKEKNITFHTEIDEDCEINADRNMIDTVLRNLLSNAIKFTHRGGTITVTMKQEASFARVSVVDSGVGMPEEIINKLFRIDSHITSEGTEREKGTGLGLILCKDFVEMNGGTINVVSTPGKGSKFTFTIPRA